VKKFGAEADGPRYCVKSTDDKLDGCDCRTKALATPATPATPAAMETGVENNHGVLGAVHRRRTRRRTRRTTTTPYTYTTAYPTRTKSHRGVHDAEPRRTRRWRRGWGLLQFSATSRHHCRRTRPQVRRATATSSAAPDKTSSRQRRVSACSEFQRDVHVPYTAALDTRRRTATRRST
jgi:hypothetical protein